MSKVAKISILILFLLLGGSIFMVLSTLNQKQALERQKADLENQLNAAQLRETKLIKDSKELEAKIKGVESAKVDIEKEVEVLNSQITGFSEKVANLTKERDDWKGRLDSIRKERDDLMVQLQSRPEPQVVVAQVPAVQPQAPPTAGTQTQTETQPESTLAKEEPQIANSGDERYWADVLKEKADLSLQVQKYKDELDSKMLEIEELKNKSAEYELKLSEITNTKDNIEQQIKYGQDLANNLSMELARAKNERKYVGDRVDKLQEENTNLRTQIKQLTSTKINLERSIARLNEDKSSVEKKLAETENIIQGRIDDIWQVKESLDKTFKAVKSTSDSKEVELPPIIVSAAGPAFSETSRYEESEPTPGLSGKVVSVNDENNFVILDLGESSGVKLGDSLSIYRGSEYVAGVEVIQVRKDISAADIKEKGAKIRAGDTVR